jgi:hypothetical protein
MRLVIRFDRARIILGIVLVALALAFVLAMVVGRI